MTERTARTPLEIARDRMGQAQSAIAKVLPVANKHGQYEMADELTKMMVALSTHGKVLSDLLYKDRKPTPLDAPKPAVQEALVATVTEHHGTMLSDGRVIGAHTRTYEVDLPPEPPLKADRLVQAVLDSALPVVAHIDDAGVMRAGPHPNTSQDSYVVDNDMVVATLPPA